MDGSDGETRVAYVFRRLYSDIQEGVLAPGSQLPAEKDIAAQYGVGRSSVREAVRSLALMGLLESQQGRRAFVTRGLLPDAAPDPLASLLRGEQLAELLDARKTIEARIAALAAERADAENLAALRALVSQSRDALQSSARQDEQLRLSIEFHLTVARMSGNAFFLRLLKSLIDANWDTSSSMGESERLLWQNCDDHEAILAAIESADPAGSSLAMARHLERFQQRVRI